MSRKSGEQARRKLNEAEGYLELDLPYHALSNSRSPGRTGRAFNLKRV